MLCLVGNKNFLLSTPSKTDAYKKKSDAYEKKSDKHPFLIRCPSVWEWKEVSAPTGEWESLITSKSKAIINSLTSGKEYSFRAVAIGSDPSRMYSDELKSFVL